jgi:peptidoglycan/LPS O-acetylase OafA/YrhL
VGVDVFFVLSGYLVTSLVIQGFHRRGNLGFRRFWSARLRRLAPAQVALIVVVTLVVAFAYRSELADLRGQVFAALTGTTNWYLIANNTSYFDQLGRPPILRHLWSLAVELQFYLVFPPLLIVALRAWRDRLDRIVLALGLAILASTIYMAVLYHPGVDPTRPYFDTFARLAAPLTGAVLALVWRPRALLNAPASGLARLSSLAGSVALVILLWIMHAAGDRSAVMYRGGFLFTALISAVVIAGLAHPRGFLGSRWAFGNPALTAIGLRSYSLYLWHWPVFVLLRPRIDVGWSWGTVFVVRMVVTVLLAEVSYRFVERPWHLRSPSTSLAGLADRLGNAPGVTPAARYTAIGSVVAVALASIIVVLPHQKKNAIADSLAEGQRALVAASRHAQDTTTTTTDPTKPTPGTAFTNSGTVTLIGDSVMVGSAPAILSAFAGRANIDAKVSRQAEILAPVIAELGREGRLGNSVVAQVGINGTVTDQNLRDISKAASGRRLFIINARVPRVWESSNNATVRRVVPSLPRARVIDWYKFSNGHRDWFLEDGVHLTQVGQRKYAALIRAAVDKVPARQAPRTKPPATGHAGN